MGGAERRRIRRRGGRGLGDIGDAWRIWRWLRSVDLGEPINRTAAGGDPRQPVVLEFGERIVLIVLADIGGPGRTLHVVTEELDERSRTFLFNQESTDRVSLCVHRQDVSGILLHQKELVHRNPATRMQELT